MPEVEKISIAQFGSYFSIQQMKPLYRLCAGNDKYAAAVRWKSPTGQYKRKYFETEKKARAWADRQNIEAKNVGLGVLNMTDELRVEALRAQALLEPWGRSILDAVATAIPVWKAAENSVTVRQAVAACLKAKAHKSDRYTRDIALRFRAFERSFADRLISGVSTKEIRQWINDHPGGATNKNTIRRRISVLFSFALENEWCRENPVNAIASMDEARGEIGILKPREAAKLLYHSPRRLTLHLAIGLFCGLRSSELWRLQPESIRLKSGLVQADIRKTRGAARRFVRIRQNLRAWILACGPLAPITEHNFYDDLQDAQDASGVEWPDNAARHSFCSYALAHEKNINELALEMGHTNPHTLFAHYRELVTPEAAAEYWRLTPARAAMADRYVMRPVAAELREPETW